MQTPRGRKGKFDRIVNQWLYDDEWAGNDNPVHFLPRRRHKKDDAPDRYNWVVGQQYQVTAYSITAGAHANTFIGRLVRQFVQDMYDVMEFILNDGKRRIIRVLEIMQWGPRIPDAQ